MTLAVLTLLVLGPAAGADPAAARAKVVLRAETMTQKPARDFPKVMRSWNLDSDGASLVRLHEVVGTVPMHLHTDSRERLILIEGRVRMTVGERTVQLQPGDYVDVPAGVKHKVELMKGTKRALVEGINEPPPDPTKTQWIEPAPAPAK